jgi:butyrate kinase
MNKAKILAINPGSTSTKIAVFQNNKSIFLKTIRHNPEELNSYQKITDQFEFRKKVIIDELVSAEIDINELTIVIGRGGLIRPVEGGVYEVTEKLKADLEKGIMGEHASNLGGLIALDIAKSIKGGRALIADPVVVDELQAVARITGRPEIERVSIFHALNQKAIARQYAKSLGKPYESLNLIVAHLGGGISVGAHHNGKVIDVNNALDGVGPFSPERAGTLPAGQLIRLCFSGKYSFTEMKKMITGNGGLMAYFGTNSAYEVGKLADQGDEQARLIQDAMAYQIGKSIGEMAAVLHGQIHAILITGGIAHNKKIIDYVKSMVEFIAPVIVYAGEDEMAALASNALLVLQGEIACKEY